MILNNILSKLYPKVYISIIPSSSTTVVCVEMYKKDKLIQNQTKTLAGHDIIQKLIDFIHSFSNESPFVYVSLLANSTSQGVLFECDATQKNDENSSDTVIKVCHGSWSAFILNDEIVKLKQKYLEVGVDFIFSPFTVLSNVFLEKKIENKTMLFVLLQEDLIVLSIFHADKLLYGDIVAMSDSIKDEELDEIAEDVDDENIEVDNTVDLDELDELDQLDELNFDDLSDLKDSESFDDLEDFAQPKEVTQEKKHDILTSSNDYKRFLIIQNALHDFYSGSKYSSEFVETVYVASFCKIEDDFKHYIEDELFLTVYIRSIDLCSDVISLAKEESV